MAIRAQPRSLRGRDGRVSSLIVAFRAPSSSFAGPAPGSKIADRINAEYRQYWYEDEVVPDLPPNQ